MWYISGRLLVSVSSEAALQCSGKWRADSFSSALNWWLQINVLLYTFLYLNFDCIFKCIYDSIVADRSIFGKGIFLLLLWFTGCNYTLYSLYDFTIFHITKLIIFLSSHHFPMWCLLLLLPFQTFWEFLHQKANFFLFCLLFYTVFNSLFIFYFYLFMLINTELGL